MLCPLCHTPNRDNAKFCKGCGRVLVTESAADYDSAPIPASSAPVEVQSVADVQRVVHEEFTRWFGSESVGPQEKYSEIAEEIWQLWQKSKLT